MLLPRKLIILAIFIHMVTIFACASLQPPQEKENKEAAEKVLNQQDDTNENIEK